MLIAEQLWFRYPNPQVEILTNWSGEIRPGVTLVQGGDGRGKSTLLRLLAGTLPADSGQLRINGVSLKEQPDAYRQQLFWIEPRTDTFDQLTPPQFFQAVRSRYSWFDAGLLNPLIEGLGLEPHWDKKLFMLSTGSKRKVWLAAAFASGAAVLLLDEPFAALDAPSIAFVKEQLQAISAQAGRAAVIADYAAPSGVTLAGVIDLGD
ncbi:ABC transporter [Polaromonas sp. YR568]|uniref:ABC transporter ATP-binding protein n=1 Tax=Polaromonas sp. YR568 TaxID=1855301 RepID=UPI0008E44673|nr:ATP-binding cassette domain-containing protein [Polaromonas sp. YR568]SFU86011.1 ABC transporter [Polaromonas sp. YR568]